MRTSEVVLFPFVHADWLVPALGLERRTSAAPATPRDQFPTIEEAFCRPPSIYHRRMPDDSAGPKTIAVTRIATGILFLLFGEYKVAGPAFAHGDFQKYLAGYIQTEAVWFYRPVLAHVVVPHAVFFGYFVGVLELWIALAMILGLFVRPSSMVGALFMLNLTLASWWGAGHGVALWRYFGAELDTIPLILLFLIFFATNAGQTWGIDGAMRRRL